MKSRGSNFPKQLLIHVAFISIHHLKIGIIIFLIQTKLHLKLLLVNGSPLTHKHMSGKASDLHIAAVL